MTGYVYILMKCVLDINKTDVVCAFNKKEDAIEALEKRANEFNTDTFQYKVKKINDTYYIVFEYGEPAVVYYLNGSRVM